jgi:hypothetical protein
MLKWILWSRFERYERPDSDVTSIKSTHWSNDYKPNPMTVWIAWGLLSPLTPPGRRWQQ